MNAIDFKNVSVEFDGIKALENVTFHIKQNEFIAIMGPNGAGKTTLLKVILGLVKPLKGFVKVYGNDPFKDPIRVRRLVGYIPQREVISQDVPIKVRDVVLMGILIQKGIPRVPSKEDIETASKALRIVDMEWAWNKLFNNLSGGQQQRVLLARAIATKPKILILDEPLTGIDVATQSIIANFLSEIKKKNITVIFVTHDINPISHISDKIMILNRQIIAFDIPNNVLKLEVLSKVYGEKIRIYKDLPYPVVITGDTHG